MPALPPAIRHAVWRDYLTPQHLLPPSGYEFTSIDADVIGYSFAITTLATVPEPATFVLAGIGFLSLLTYVRQRHRRSPSYLNWPKASVIYENCYFQVGMAAAVNCTADPGL
jgi:hypothetical protein